MVTKVVIAVPVSDGYGVAEGGKVASGGALSACSPGAVAVNTDNRFGAACAMVKILHTNQTAHVAQSSWRDQNELSQWLIRAHWYFAYS